MELLRQRLHNQRLGFDSFETPEQVVGWMGAVQSQYYLDSLWAIGLRANQLTEDAVERAITDKRILRTWPMRGTVHFTNPEDIRWILQLTRPSLHSYINAIVKRERLDLDEAAFGAADSIFVKALEGGKQLTGGELRAEFERAGRGNWTGLRFTMLMQRAQADGLVCYGPRRGKQPTLTLLDEWAPGGNRLLREAALAEFARRYFTSHGPATVQDFTWWSGLTAAETRAGLAEAMPDLVNEVIDGRTYWSGPVNGVHETSRPTAHLLPAYDEYAVAYKDRSGFLQPQHRAATGYGIFKPTILINGRTVGTWKRIVRRADLVISLAPLTALNDDESGAVIEAAQRFGAFLAKPTSVELTDHGHASFRR